MIAKVSNILTVIIVSSAIFESDGQSQNPFFRKDYTFLPEAQNFYKINMMHKNWQNALEHCTREGARLFYGEDSTEVMAVLNYWNTTHSNRRLIFVGINQFLAKGVLETYDGVPINEIYNVWAPGEPYVYHGTEDCTVLRSNGEMVLDFCEKKFPFICKKSLSSLEWNVLCDLPDNEFVFNSETGKCYKFHEKPLNWTEAHSVCSAEQSYLAVINSQQEADQLVRVSREHKTQNDSDILLGFHKKLEDEWKTVKGTTLKESGYSKWGKGQPDGASDACGSMSDNDGLLNDISCSAKRAYICEHDIAVLGNSINNRLKENSVEKPHCVCT